MNTFEFNVLETREGSTRACLADRCTLEALSLTMAARQYAGLFPDGLPVNEGAARFIDLDENLFTLGSDRSVTVQLPDGARVTVYRTGVVACDDGQRFRAGHAEN